MHVCKHTFIINETMTIKCATLDYQRITLVLFWHLFYQEIVNYICDDEDIIAVSFMGPIAVSFVL